MREAVTWLAILGVAAMYMRQTEKKKPTTVQLSAQKEVDPTRWRHDGSQPTTVHDGNKGAVDDTESRMLLAMLA